MNLTLKRKIKKTKVKQITGQYHDEYAYRGHRTKTSWKGVGPGNAFNSTLIIGNDCRPSVFSTPCASRPKNLRPGSL